MINARDFDFDSMKEKYVACLMGGAMGDALGYPVEFMKKSDIISRYGELGIQELVLDQKTGKAIISDDTQMTLFTADGLIWAHLRIYDREFGTYEGSGMIQSYYRWYYTQTGTIDNNNWLEKQPHELETHFIKYNKTILEYNELYVRRAPGNTCLSALANNKTDRFEDSINNSKGCGGVMRVAPVGLFLHNNLYSAMRHGMGIAELTHGHPTGYISAGAFSIIIAEIINGKSLEESLLVTLEMLKEIDTNGETTIKLKNAIFYAKSEIRPSIAIKKLGEGWIAEEALAIAVYCALKEKHFKKALQLAVNHDGDSDSTGSICGNILGVMGGMKVIPEEWIQKIELKELIIDMGEKLFQLNEKFRML